MPKYITCKQLTVKILIESLLYASGALLMKHDGKVFNGSRDQIKTTSHYIRKYEILLRDPKTGNFQKTGVMIKFVYNDREDWGEVEITGYDLMELKLQQKLKGVGIDRIQIPQTVGDSQIRAGDGKAGGIGDSTQPGGFPDRLQKSEG